MPSITTIFVLTCIAMSIEAAVSSVPDYNQQIKNLYHSRLVNSEVEESTTTAALQSPSPSPLQSSESPSPPPLQSSESPSLSPSPSPSPLPSSESPSPSPVLLLQGINISAIPAGLLQQLINTTYTTQSNYVQIHKPTSTQDSSKDGSVSHSRGFAVHEGDVGYDGPVTGSYSMSGSGSGSGFGHHHTIHVQSTAAPRLVASVAAPMLVVVAMLLAVLVL